MAVRISEVGKIAPHGGPGRLSQMSKEHLPAGNHHRIWQELAPRLIHPTKIELIEALSWLGEPLSTFEFHALLSASESSIDYLRYHLKGLCSAGVFVEVPDRTARLPEDRRYWFNCSEADDEPTSR